MQNWIDSEFFDHWKDAQARITKSLSAQGPANNFSGNAYVWQKPAINLMCQWGESAVKQSLELQAAWIEQWIQRPENTSVSLQTFSELVRQINQEMDRWSKTQGELWKFWFDMLDNTVQKSSDSGPNRKKIATWKRVVNEARLELNDWFTKWEEQINCKPLVPDDLNRLTEKLGQEMLGWIQNQAVLWQYGFDFVKAASTGTQDPKPMTFPHHHSTSEKDDLTAISGIGPVIEQLLNKHDIVSYQHIANLSDEEINHLENDVIRFPGQIRRKEWIQQATELARISHHRAR